MTPTDFRRPELLLLPVSPVQAQRILTIEFTSPDGRSWSALGGGDTLEAAIDWARESCPHGTTWEPIGWADVYGD